MSVILMQFAFSVICFCLHHLFLVLFTVNLLVLNSRIFATDVSIIKWLTALGDNILSCLPWLDILSFSRDALVLGRCVWGNWLNFLVFLTASCKFCTVTEVRFLLPVFVCCWNGESVLLMTLNYLLPNLKAVVGIFATWTMFFFRLYIFIGVWMLLCNDNVF